MIVQMPIIEAPVGSHLRQKIIEHLQQLDKQIVTRVLTFLRILFVFWQGIEFGCSYGKPFLNEWVSLKQFQGDVLYLRHDGAATCPGTDM
jgi:hypothetical protein